MVERMRADLPAAMKARDASAVLAEASPASPEPSISRRSLVPGMLRCNVHGCGRRGQTTSIVRLHDTQIRGRSPR